jgi:hypothetical protein
VGDEPARAGFGGRDREAALHASRLQTTGKIDERVRHA